MGSRHNVNNKRVNVLQRQRQQRNRSKNVLEKQGLIPATAVTTAHPKSAKKARQLKTALKLNQKRLAKKGKIVPEEEMKDVEASSQQQKSASATNSTGMQVTSTGKGTTLGKPACA
ncbi:hypothetical protein BDF19DRAFT_445518 [Syncephalis fuscata]|nr:hypothetical protein BDF19DRAFT_445518 [Syncephalis fuscata]